jgi:anionic cell wall polymer biosynthesis LytR-Cps2A-Psr (LCP) family protein
VSETDLTRELRQQKLIMAMKSQILSFTGFLHLPWIAWALPQTIETDMDAPTLAAVLASLGLNGNAHSRILYPTGTVGVSGLTIDSATKQADVAAFLRS